MQQIIEFFLKYYTTICLIGSSIIGIIYFLRRWIKDGIKSIKLSISFYEHFGDFPAKKIKELHDTISRSSNTLELRQSITESHIKIGIYICEAETGRCLWTNQYLNDLFEMDSSEMKGYGWAGAIDNNDSARVLDVWRTAVSDNNPYYASYKIKGRLTHVVKEVTTHAIALMDEDNQKVCYVGYMYEVK